MTMEEVLQVASMGVEQGCAEILFTLGEPHCLHRLSMSLSSPTSSFSLSMYRALSCASRVAT